DRVGAVPVGQPAGHAAVRLRVHGGPRVRVADPGAGALGRGERGVRGGLPVAVPAADEPGAGVPAGGRAAAGGVRGAGRPAPAAAPADARRPVLLTRLGWYAFAMAVVTVLAAVGYRLDAHDLHVPLLYYDHRGLETDSLLILPMVQATLEGGTHWHCDRLG